MDSVVYYTISAEYEYGVEGVYVFMVVNVVV